LLKFAISGVLLGGALWLTEKFAAAHLSLAAFRDEAALVLLIVVGGAVYVGAILALFGLKWLRSLVRS
jgi:putative peptidoglycan lipid II flippase